MHHLKNSQLDLYDNSEHPCSMVAYKSSWLYFHWCVLVLYNTDISLQCTTMQNTKLKHLIINFTLILLYQVLLLLLVRWNTLLFRKYL